jgi:tRNA pseudouridine55 synthase
VGPFTFDEPYLSPNGLEAGPGVKVPLLSPAEAARRCFPVIELDEAEATAVRYGQALRRPAPADPTALIAGDELLALYRPDGERAVPVAVFVAG